jgi:hypothetical protein
MDGLAAALLARPAARAPASVKIAYVLLRNAAPSAVEFARLFAEISLLDRASDAGPVLFAACRKAHKRRFPSFSFDALPDAEQRQYRAACFGKACAACGDGVHADATFCSPACEERCCARCLGLLEVRRLECQVHDVRREMELRSLSSVLRAKGVVEPLPYCAQLECYHAACKGKVSCSTACDECQGRHLDWLQQHDDFKALGRMPEAFWAQKEARFDELRQLPVTKQLVSHETRCPRCGSDATGERLLQRRRL